MNADLCLRFCLGLGEQPPAPLPRPLLAFTNVARCHGRVRGTARGAGDDEPEPPETRRHAHVGDAMRKNVMGVWWVRPVYQYQY